MNAMAWFEREKDRHLVTLVQMKRLYPARNNIMSVIDRATTIKKLEELSKQMRGLLTQMFREVPRVAAEIDRLSDIIRQVDQLSYNYGQPDPNATRPYHIVWNESKTEGFVTTDGQLAYEVRKGADTNCCTEDGEPAPVAVAFIHRWIDDSCTIETVDKTKE
jgi:hypothetical protein